MPSPKSMSDRIRVDAAKNQALISSGSSTEDDTEPRTGRTSLAQNFQQHPLIMALALLAVAVVLWILWGLIVRRGSSSSQQQYYQQPQTSADLQVQSQAPAVSIYPPNSSTTTTVGPGAPPTAPADGVDIPRIPPAPMPWLSPLLGRTPSSPIKFGQTAIANGTTYTLGTGNQGRIWGVPGIWTSLSSWNNVPIGPGQKQLIYGL